MHLLKSHLRRNPHERLETKKRDAVRAACVLPTLNGYVTSNAFLACFLDSHIRFCLTARSTRLYDIVPYWSTGEKGMMMLLLLP